MSEVLIESEDANLFVTYDTLVKDGAEAFESVVLALKRIHSRKLYRFEFGSFESYVNNRLGWSKSKAYRLIADDDDKASHDGTDTTQINNEETPVVQGEIVEDDTMPAEILDGVHSRPDNDDLPFDHFKPPSKPKDADEMSDEESFIADVWSVIERWEGTQSKAWLCGALETICGQLVPRKAKR